MLTSGVDRQEGGGLPQKGRGYAIAAGILGWTLDAFDFFVVVFLVDTLATHFQVGKGAIVLTIGATLAMRPVGALLFGMLADRYGRRKPLMAVVAYFSLIEVLSGLALNYPIFLVLRLLYGIGMGGFWGVGASLTLESAPRRWRGLLSGLLQGGYPLGYLLSAVAARLILPLWGWRAMFWAGLIPGIITLYIAYKSPESEAWKQHRVPSMGGILQVVWDHRKSFAYLVVMLTLMTCLSHGTQDLYPDFLKTAHHISPNVVAYLAMFYNVGALLGTISVGHTSERLGRRISIIGALTLCALVIPLWAFGHSLPTLALGAFLMQVGVQGAWGVMPAHLNELSPDAVRSLFPGFVYQLGVLFGSPTNTIEYALRDRIGYQWALTVFEGCTILALVIVFALGPERKGRNFFRKPVEIQAGETAS
ncbi:MAG TPA: MFS transporter [Candidatus Dormibacteraeota bacterium]|nr:MFS transporter [Candidatus Dormibacteraeota bacterium]